MKQYPPSDIQRFLMEADAHLTSHHELLIIGGAAAALVYKAARATTDIDTIGEIPKELLQAFEIAAKNTGLEIPVSPVGVYDAPYCYEDRIQQYDDIKLRFLRISVPEQHDLALMKIVRGYENDIQTISDIHKNSPFSFETLLQRFLSEMSHVVGRPEVIRQNFLVAIDTLFGSELAEQAENEIGKPRAELHTIL